MSTQYSPEEKAAYWKAKAMSKARSNSSSRRRPRSRRPSNSRQTRYASGEGAYNIPRNFFSAKRLGGYLGGVGGAAIGNMLAPGIGSEPGARVGEIGGEYLGRLFKKITGWGDYEVKSNSLVPGLEHEVVPSFGEDSIRVRKREFVSSINSKLLFQNREFAINPGLASSFPWLSAIAANYEQYRVNGMIFQFVSTSSDAIASNTNLGLGQVILATNYDAGADPFVDGPQMLNFMFSNSGKPSENIMHAIECAPNDTAQQLYYTRVGAVPEGRDPRLYDLGLFQIAVDNMPAAYDGMGQLWVSYDITFCKSQSNNELGFSILQDKFAFTTGIDNSHPFGTAVDPATPEIGSTLGCYIDQENIFFPENIDSGYYLVQIMWRGTSTSLTGPLFTGTNCKGVDSYLASEFKFQCPSNNISSARLSVSTVVKMNTLDTGDQCVLGIGSQVLPTSATQCWVTITQVNGDIFDEYAVATGTW